MQLLQISTTYGHKLRWHETRYSFEVFHSKGPNVLGPSCSTAWVEHETSYDVPTFISKEEPSLGPPPFRFLSLPFVAMDGFVAVRVHRNGYAPEAEALFLKMFREEQS